MKTGLRMLLGTGLWSLTALAALMCFAKIVFAKEPEPLTVDIRTPEGESILVKEGCPFYSSVPVIFTVQSGGGPCYYSMRAKEDEEFGPYVEMEESELTVYPDGEGAPDGRRDIRFLCPDVGASPVYSLIFDLIPPKVDMKYPDEMTGCFTGDDTVRFVISDDKSGVSRIIKKCNGSVIEEIHRDLSQGRAEDDAEIETEFPVTDTGMAENEAKIECFDLAGNHSCVSFTYRMDKSIPDVSLEGVEDGTYHASAVELVISGYDKDSPVYVNHVIQREYKDEVYTDEVTNIEDKEKIVFEDKGEYRVRAWAVDAGGNTSGEKTVSFVIDDEPPDVSIEGVEDNADLRSEAKITIGIREKIYKGSMVDIMLTRTALGKKENIVAESYELEADNEIREVNITTDGEYELILCARDGAGNRTDVAKSFTIDKTAPDISLSGIREGEITSEKPVIRFAAGEMFYDSAVMSTILEKKEKGGYVKVAGLDRLMSAPKDFIDVKIPGEGQFRLTGIAADRNGNTSSSSIEFTVDHTPPVIADLSDMNNRFFRSFSLPGRVENMVSDATKVSVDAYVNDDRIGEDDVIVKEGKYLLNILAEDEAGNVSDGRATFIVDHTGPQIVLSGCDRDGNVKREAC